MLNPTEMPTGAGNWLPIALLLVVAIGFAVSNIAASLIVGPSREGDGKSTTYESGMLPVGNTRQRFNVRFYLVAILFVAFDVEVVVMYPWATAFAQALQADNAGVAAASGLGLTMLIGIAIFTLLLLVGYAYDIGKGVFEFE
ncbi:MAG: NADH-quinone oxidoreductase subunit A [Planctomycetota bacterium]